MVTKKSKQIKRGDKISKYYENVGSKFYEKNGDQTLNWKCGSPPPPPLNLERNTCYLVNMGLIVKLYYSPH